MTLEFRLLMLAAPLALAACHSEPAPGADTAIGELTASPVTDPGATYDGIAEDETLHFSGTEPFWGGQVVDRTLTYTTPEDQSGQVIEIERFAGRGGISFSGLLEGKEFTMTATPLACSDGMSDRTYPFTVTLKIGEEQRNGCGWTDKQPIEAPPNP
ncbi:MAG: hypothetical protein ABIT16_07835 [Croceibacterium sp.]